jgi:hypothetical protein
MDTGGKVATGVVVPLAVGGAAVAAYFLFFKKKNNTKSKFIKDDSWDRIFFDDKGNATHEKQPRTAPDLPHNPAYSNGGRVKKHKTRRHRQR